MLSEERALKGENIMSGYVKAQRLFGLITCIILGYICIAVLSHDWIGRNALSVLGKIIFEICVLTVLFVVYRVMRSFAGFFQKYGKYILLLFVVVVFPVQLYISYIMRFTPQYDFLAIYHGAIEWVEQGSFPDYYEYFSYYPNNLGGLTFLYIIFKLSSFLGFHDYYMAGAIVNSLLSLLMIILLYYCIQKTYTGTEACYSLFLYLIFCPLYVWGGAFYTDCLTFVYPVCILALYLYGCDKKEKSRIWSDIAMGIAAFIGYKIKATVFIVMIAVWIVLCLTKQLKRAAFVICSSILLLLAGNAVFNAYFYSGHIDPENAKELETPVEAWIYMGLNENIGFSGEDTEQVRNIAASVRKEQTRQLLVTRLESYSLKKLYVHEKQKMVTAFSDGTLDLSSTLMFGRDSTEGPLTNYVLQYGKHYGTYWDYCSGIYYCYYILGILGLFLTLTVYRKKYEMNGAGLIVALALTGLACFLAIWEVHPRYTANFNSYIIYAAVAGMAAVCKRIPPKSKRLQL